MYYYRYMKNVVNSSSQSTAEEIFNELKKDISDAKLVLYFAPEKVFRELTKLISEEFPGTKSMGCTTCGVISASGEQEFSSQAIWFTDGIECTGGVIPDIASFPLQSVQKIKNSIESLSSTENTVCLEFTTAFSLSEELVLTALDSVTCEYNIPVTGGTCGVKNYDHETTLVSENGKVYENSAVYMFIRNLNGSISIYKENVYVPTKHTFTATLVDIKNRIVKELNRKPAKLVLKDAFHLKEAEIEPFLKEHPLGRITEKELYVSACEKVNYDNSISYSSRIFNNTKVSVLETGNFPEITKGTIKKIREDFEEKAINATQDAQSGRDSTNEQENPLNKAENLSDKQNGQEKTQNPAENSPSLVFLIHCDARKTLFEKNNFHKTFLTEWQNSFSSLSGFYSHGEQLGKIHFNLTLLAVVFE